MTHPDVTQPDVTQPDVTQPDVTHSHGTNLDVRRADPIELVRSARRLSGVSTALGEVARDLLAASGLLTQKVLGGGASGVRAEVGALAASLRRQQVELAAVAAEFSARAEAVELARGGSWTAGQGGTGSGSHPTPTWAVVGAQQLGDAALADLDRSARRTRAALAALLPDRIPVDSDLQDVTGAMRRQIAARLGAHNVRPG